jgi:hypothetical protein
MLLQQILIIFFFGAAIGYLVFRFRKTFDLKKKGCGEGCGCSSIDLDKIEREILKKS